MFYNLLCWKCIQTLDSQPHQTYFALPYHICVTVTAVLRNLFGGKIMGKIPFVTGKYHTLAPARWGRPVTNTHANSRNLTLQTKTDGVAPATCYTSGGRFPGSKVLNSRNSRSAVAAGHSSSS